ncbi:MAG TPA: hypothetical protein P5081_02955 [Phycisphaerae bacterium]|nr:hypothetical protein [Phycisphaerae bacterium]HRW51818.1 hypothetical protein [Phycisphaerae bacterium]
MRFSWRIIAVSFLGAPMACLSAPAANSGAQSESGSTLVNDVDPMASFARMEAGEWRLGSIQFDTWQWGPARRSMRALTVGTDGQGNPWRELVVYYWRPDRRRVCLLGFHPDIPGVGRGVASGEIEFRGETITTRFDLFQPRAPEGRPRRMGGRWVFDGPDKYHEALLEDNGAGLQPLAEWDYVRSMERSAGAATAEDRTLKPSKNLAAFEPLLGHWRARGKTALRGEFDIESSFEWATYLDVITLRVMEAYQGGGSTHALDAYVYHHVGSNSLRCLALSASGAVYEGGVSVPEDGALQLNLTGCEADGKTEYLLRFDSESDGALRQRVWSVDGERRALALDIRHRRVDSRRDESTQRRNDAPSQEDAAQRTPPGH